MDMTINTVSFYYQKNTPFEAQALDQVSFQIQPGEAIALIGPSGSGKSCLLRCLAGALTPSAGTIDGVQPPVGLVIQEPEQQFFADTVREEVGYALRIRGQSVSAVDMAVRQALVEVGYLGDWEASPFRLSGGQQRRIAMASILVMQPKVLLLDEPTVGMDHHGLDLIRHVLANYRKTKRIAIVASHDLDFLYSQVDRYLVLKSGRLLADFRRQEFNHYAPFLTEQHIGVPEYVRLQNRKLPDEIREYIR